MEGNEEIPDSDDGEREEDWARVSGDGYWSRTMPSSAPAPLHTTGVEAEMEATEVHNNVSLTLALFASSPACDVHS